MVPTLIPRLFFESIICVTIRSLPGTISFFQQCGWFFGSESDFLRQVWFKENRLPSSLATKYVDWKRKKVDSCKRNMKDQNNVEKSRSLKSSKATLQKKKSCDKNKRKNNFLLLTEMMILIHIHMEIKRIQTVKVFHFLDFVDLEVIEGNVWFWSWWLDVISTYNY